MDKRLLRCLDINRADGHHTFGIAEKVIIKVIIFDTKIFSILYILEVLLSLGWLLYLFGLLDGY